MIMDVGSTVIWTICLLNLFVIRNKYRTLQKRIRSKYKEYGITAELPFNRAKVLILGDESAGKTSTRKRLCGEGFNENMPRTEGIEITNVTYNWKKVKSSDDDFEKLASYAAIGEHFRTENEKPDLFYYIGSVLLFMVVTNLGILTRYNSPSISNFCATLLWLNFILLPIADHYYNDCVVSGGFSVFQMFTHLVIVIFASVFKNIVFCGPLSEHCDGLRYFYTFMGQVTYNVFTLFLFNRLLFRNDSDIGVVSRSPFDRGCVLGLLLVFHHALHRPPIEYSTKVTLIVQLFVIYNFTLGIIRDLFHRFVKHSTTILAATIFCIVCASLIFVSGIIVLALDFEQAELFMHMLYACVWMYMYVIQLNSLGHSLTPFLQVPRVLLNLGFGLIIGLLAGLFCGIFAWVVYTIEISKIIVHKDIQDKYILSSTLEMFLSIVVFMVVETYLWMEDETDVPMSHLNDAVTAYKFGSCSLDKRWIICDFAGQQIYYDTHHIFIPRQGVFLVVFDASKFIANGSEDFRGLVERVQFWVQSVAIHADEENSVVFVIGTHKNLLNDDQLSRLSKAVEDKLYAQYKRILKFNESTKRMVFFIENKDYADQEREDLRIAIGEEAAKLPFIKKECPIRYHLFQRIISAKRQQQQQNNQIISKRSLREEMVKVFREEMGDKRTDERMAKEFDEILQFSNNSGDIFYESMDGNDEEYIIMDLHILVNVVQVLVNIPERCHRQRHMANQWQIFETRGIIDKQLLLHIFNRHNIYDKCCDVLIDVLTRKDILFALPDEDQYLFLGNLQEGRPNTSDEPKGKVDLYASFTLFRADHVFLRLLSRLEGLQTDTISRKAAKFTESGGTCYAISVMEREPCITSSEISRHGVLKISIWCSQASSIRDVAFKIRAAIHDVFASTRLENEDEDRLKLGYLCEDCGILTEIYLHHGRECRTIVTDSHTITEANELVDGLVTVAIKCRSRNPSATTCRPTHRPTHLSARKTDQWPCLFWEEKNG